MGPLAEAHRRWIEPPVHLLALAAAFPVQALLAPAAAGCRATRHWQTLPVVYNPLMAKTLSTMLPLGTPLPEFSLPDVTTGDTVSSSDFGEQSALLVMFLSRHCPFVKHVQAELAKLCNEYLDKDVAVVAICSNDVESHPDDGPDGLRQMSRELGFRFPYLFDESQDVARAFVAACTPDFFLFGNDRTLVYRGQFDDSRPGSDVPVTGADLRAALDAARKGLPAPSEQRPSVGCNIKWKAAAIPGRGD